MTRTTSGVLLEILAQVPDPRKAKGKRHPLSAILGLAVLAIMCGYRSYSTIAEWGRTYSCALVKRLGFTHAKTPCAATLHNLFKRLDIAKLEQVLTQWTTETLQSVPQATDRVALAIDGKQLKGSAGQNATVSHLLSVVSHQLGVTIAQKAVDTKTNEIPISTEILSAFDIKGMIVTTDALLTQRDFCKKVCALDGDYVVPVALNHRQLHQDIACLFAPPMDVNTVEGTVNPLQQMHTELDQNLDTHQTVEKGHGRIEIRRLTASTALNDYIQWPGVNQVFEYSYQRIELSTGQVKQKTQYGITSLTPDQAAAIDLFALRRGHWTIENKSHWIRDMVLGEDASQVREGVIPQVMSALRNTALAVLRFAGHQSISKAMRYFAAHPQNALNLINTKNEN